MNSSLGGCRTGNESHDVPNLFEIDESVFPSAARDITLRDLGGLSRDKESFGHFPQDDSSPGE